MNILKAASINCVVVGLISVVACAEPEHSTAEKTSEEVDSLKLASTSAIQPDENYYPIPSPEEMFEFIKANQLKYDPAKVISNDISKFSSEEQKAIAFGVFSTNLAYVASFEDFQKSISFYKTIRELGNDLGIEGAVTQNTMNRIQAHLDQPDSLMKIVNNSYRESVAFLENNKRGNVMAVIAASGWVESMHIVLSSVEKFDESNDVMQRIADQKLVFGNLLAYLKDYSDDPMVMNMMKKVSPVREVFSSFEERKTGKISNQKKGKKLILGGGTKIHMSAQQFLQLKSSVEQVRRSMLNETI